MGDQGQFSSLLTKIIPKHGPPRKEGKRKIGQLKEGTKENDKGAQEHSRLITQNGSKVNTIDVTRAEAQRRSDSLQRDVQACIRSAARSERLAPAGPIQLDNRVRVTRDDYESSRP